MEMEELSHELNMEFSEDEDHATTRALNFISYLNDDEHCFALHNIWGKYNGYEVEVFDYHYKEEGVWWWSPSWHKHRYHSFVVLKLEKDFPELLMNADQNSPFKRIAKAFGSRDIDFESKEFSERYDVRCKDKKFAYDFCNARMIDYLLSKPTIPVEVENHVIAIGIRRFIPVSRVEDHIDHLVNIRQLMPGYLFEMQEQTA